MPERFVKRPRRLSPELDSHLVALDALDLEVTYVGGILADPVRLFRRRLQIGLGLPQGDADCLVAVPVYEKDPASVPPHLLDRLNRPTEGLDGAFGIFCLIEAHPGETHISSSRLVAAESTLAPSSEEENRGDVVKIASLLLEESNLNDPIFGTR